MQAEKKYLNGLLNADDDFALVAPNEFVNASNIRFGSTDSGATGRFEKVGGTTLLFNTFLEAVGTDTYTNLAACEDEARQRIIFITYNANTTGGLHLNAIYCYDKAAATTYTVLKYDQVTPSSLLQFSVDKYIDAMRMWGDLLYWTDGINETRVINIEAGIKLNHGGYSTTTTAYVAPLKEEDISLMKRPCSMAPIAKKKYNAAFTDNFVENEAFQFAVQYEYADSQKTVLSPWSNLVHLNFKTPSVAFNYIQVLLPSNELIPQTVQVVRLFAYNRRTNTWQQAKKWDMSIDTENIYLTTHNNGGSLYFDFYNDLAGQALSDAEANKLEDLVPKKSQTLEVNSDRLFVGNNTYGYANPTKSSLAVTKTQGSPLNGSITAQQLYLIDIPFTRYIISGASATTESRFFRGYFVKQEAINPAGYYVLNANYTQQTGSYLAPTVPGANVNISDLTFMGQNLEEVQDAIGTLLGYVTSATSNSVTTPATIDLLGSSNEYVRSLKTGSSLQTGINFYDKFMRYIGMYNVPLSVNTDRRENADTSFDNAIKWTLSNTNALNEIPSEAHYYSIDKTLNLKMRFFVQGYTQRVTYLTKQDDGTYSKSAVYAAGSFLSFDISDLTTAGLGYVFNEGDLCRFTYYRAPSTNYNEEMTISLVYGKYLVLEDFDAGLLLGTDSVYYEIYTPYKPSEAEFFYETGTVYPVTDAGTSSRVYSVLQGYLDGDVYFFSRTATGEVIEAMSPNDKYWKEWYTNTGRPVLNVRNREVTETNGVAWSNTRFLGTQINGSSQFELLNKQSLSVDAGAIRKLQNASRLQEEGGVMLAICERETLSLYVGRAQVSDETQFNLLLKTDTVIGTVNGLRGSFGTKHPESVVEHRGNVYWFDVVNGAFVRYAGNGLFDISSMKFKRPTTLFAERVRELTISGGSVPNFRNKILGGVDVKHEEVLWSIPETYTTPPKGRLSDYDNTAAYNYPYDIYDGLAKTLVYKIAGEKWMGSYSMQSDGFVSLNNELHSFNQGLYKNNNTAAYNTFYGTAYPSKIMFVCNMNPSEVKTFKAVGIETDTVPTWTHMRTEWPNVQSSELAAAEYTDKEGRYYASTYRDRLSPNTGSSDYDVRMIKGDPMRGQFLLVDMEFAGAGSQMNLRFVTIYYNSSYGHKQ